MSKSDGLKLDGPRQAPASGGAAKKLIILLHGYGADGNDLIGLAPHFASVLPDAAFVSPNAPEPCGQAPMGYQWWDIADFSPEARASGADQAGPILNQFIDDELAAVGLDESSLALIGFSQGTMMSLHVGLRREKQLAAIVGFSGALVAPERLPAEIQTRPPVLLIHGDADPMLPVQNMTAAIEGLASAGITAQHHISAGVGHGIAADGLQLAVAFSASI
jgi:phospholipase/carboxylesterase